MQEESSYYEDDMFVSAGTTYLKVGELVYKNRKIRPTILPYADQLVMVDQLIHDYIDNENIKLEGRDQVGFKLSKGSILKTNYSIKFIKQKLHNYTCDYFEVTPFVSQTFGYQLECFQEQNYGAEAQNRLETDKSNYFDIAFYFQSYHRTHYKSICADNSFQFAVDTVVAQHFKEILNEPYEVYYKNNFIPKAELLKVKIKNNGLLKIVSKKPKTLTFPNDENSERKIFIYYPGSDHPKQQIYQHLRFEKVWSINQKIALQIPPRSFKLFAIKFEDVILRPLDQLSKIQSHLRFRQNKGQAIRIILVPESEVFYDQIPKIRSEQKFSFGEILLLDKNQQQKCRNVSTQRIQDTNHNESTIFQNENHVSSIVYYTSPFCYNRLNEYLRDIDFLNTDYANLKVWEFKLTSALIQSLEALPNYDGVVYRGSRHKQVGQEGSIIHFKSFSSTSTNLEKAKSFGGVTLYTIKTFTGKCIKNFSYFQKEDEVLIMPFTFFKMTSKKQNQGTTYVDLLELPTPKRKNANILFWIDDNSIEGSIIFKNLYLQHPKIKTELVQLLSNDHFQLWLQEFQHYVNTSKNKICLITDMKRGDDMSAGVKTVQLARSHLKSIDIFVYVGDIVRTEQTLLANKLNLSDNLLLGNKTGEVKDFILKKVLTEEELKGSECQLI